MAIGTCIIKALVVGTEVVTLMICGSKLYGHPAKQTTLPHKLESKVIYIHR